ncbi:DUF3243 domain-containing protein [Paenibacillus xerothermodurans]|uniref:DUF3243 domain-containing protein n=1 Tax=Paenibacillus xerothermodurans TaxID=1977292 RepID=A0A2W1NCF1_PAEXE|nr:DUF3243 domain-containing protein [Paenibacillus xerothermodurans]PZE22389.1 DUF3243 domain-containing protein [Paenibacillus xerothermodurans]
MATVLNVFDRWKEFLNERVQQAEQSGMKEETINKLAVEIGDFLAKNVDAENSQERVLKQLWDVANQEEQKTIARLMVKLVTPAQQTV